MIVGPDADSAAEADGPDTTGTPDARLDAAFDAAEAQLRGVVKQVITAARVEIEAAEADIAQREAETAALQAALAAERLHLVADRKELVKHVSVIRERERAVDGAAAEVAELREQATTALATALERSAQLVEQAEAQAAERAASAKAAAEAELSAARDQASATQAQLARRVEAVGVESEAILQRAVDHGLMIVSTAKESAERSKAELREVIVQMQEFLDREETKIELDAEVEIDLRDPLAADPVDTGSDAVLVAAGNTGAADAADLSDASDASGPSADPTDPSDVHVADAVRRAVRDWSVARGSAD